MAYSHGRRFPARTPPGHRCRYAGYSAAERDGDVPAARTGRPAAFLAGHGVTRAGQGGWVPGGVTSAEQVREMRQSLGRELAARRREAGYSQRQLAPLTG